MAIDLSHVSRYPKPEDTFDVISNAINIGIDFNTRKQLKKADIVVPLDLSRYSLTNNAKCLEELYMEGYHPMKKTIRRVLWYKRMNVFIYLLKAARELLPLKVPEIIKDLKRHPLAARNRS